MGFSLEFVGFYRVFVPSASPFASLSAASISQCDAAIQRDYPNSRTDAPTAEKQA
jgi:hypothetical protein